MKYSVYHIQFNSKYSATTLTITSTTNLVVCVFKRVCFYKCAHDSYIRLTTTFHSFCIIIMCACVCVRVCFSPLSNFPIVITVSVYLCFFVIAFTLQSSTLSGLSAAICLTIATIITRATTRTTTLPSQQQQ